MPATCKQQKRKLPMRHASTNQRQARKVLRVGQSHLVQRGRASRAQNLPHATAVLNLSGDPLAEANWTDLVATGLGGNHGLCLRTAALQEYVLADAAALRPGPLVQRGESGC